MNQGLGGLVEFERLVLGIVRSIIAIMASVMSEIGSGLEKQRSFVTFFAARLEFFQVCFIIAMSW